MLTVTRQIHTFLERENKINSERGMLKFDRKRAPWVALISVLLIYTFVWGVIGVRYEVNDDATLSNIAAGAYGANTQYLVYINILVGWFLKPFFALFPGFNWLYALQTVAVIAALTILFCMVLNELGMERGLPVAFLVICVYGIDLFYSFQYVKNSGICLIVGFLLFAKHLGHWNFYTFLGGAFVVFGSMLRFQNFMAVGALSAMLLLTRFSVLDSREKKAAILSFLLLLSVVCLVKGIDILSYQMDDGWRTFTKYNDVRTSISDFRLQFLQDPEGLASLQYSANDVDVLRGWQFWDNEVFSVEKLNGILQTLPNNSFSNTLRQMYSYTMEILNAAPFHLLFCTLCLLWLICAKKCSSLGFVGTVFILGALMLYLAYRGRYPHRVDFVLICAATLFGWQCCRWQGSVKLLNLRFLAAITGLFALACFPYWYQHRIDMKEYRETSVDSPKYHQYSADKEHIYLLDVDVLDSISGYDVLHPRTKDFFSNIVFLGGWLSMSPFQTDVLRQYDVANPYRDMIDNERVYLVDYLYVQTKEMFLKEHYNANVRCEIVDNEGTFWTWQIKT